MSFRDLLPWSLCACYWLTLYPFQPPVPTSPQANSVSHSYSPYLALLHCLCCQTFFCRSMPFIWWFLIIKTVFLSNLSVLLLKVQLQWSLTNYLISVICLGSTLHPASQIMWRSFLLLSYLFCCRAVGSDSVISCTVSRMLLGVIMVNKYKYLMKSSELSKEKVQLELTSYVNFCYLDL